MTFLLGQIVVVMNIIAIRQVLRDNLLDSLQNYWRAKSVMTSSSDIGLELRSVRQLTESRDESGQSNAAYECFGSEADISSSCRVASNIAVQVD